MSRGILISRRGVMAKPIATSFSFEDPGGLQGWWDPSNAASISPQDGSNNPVALADGVSIAAYANLAAAGAWTLTQTTHSQRPTYETSIFGSLPSMHTGVTGSNDTSLTGTAAANRVTGTGMAIFIVAIRRSSQADVGLISVNKSSDSTDWSSVNGALIATETASSNRQQNYVSAAVRADIASAPANDVPYLFSTWFDGTTNFMERRQSGSTTSASAAFTGTFTIDRARVGQRIGSSDSNHVDYGPILIYNSALTAPNRALVQASLMSTWGIA